MALVVTAAKEAAEGMLKRIDCFTCITFNRNAKLIN
jgi:hypothetical protein